MDGMSTLEMEEEVKTRLRIVKKEYLRDWTHIAKTTTRKEVVA